MKSITIVCLLEEPSAQKMLEAVLPRILPEINQIVYLPFQGKQDLDRNIVIKIKNWKKPNSIFLILRDKDSGNCLNIKKDIADKLLSIKKLHKCCIRIACHELESFYLGDLLAVEKGLQISGLSKKQNQKKFRNPDSLANASEELEKLTQNKYQKVSGSRAIAPYLNINGENKSHSFNVLLSRIKRLVDKLITNKAN